MKRITFYMAVTLCAFLIGVVLTISWFQSPKIKKNPDQYFPTDKFGDERRGQFINKCIGNNLKAMLEPSLYSSVGEVKETYRVLYAPSFKPQIAVRIWRDRDKRYLSVKKLDSDYCFEKRTLVFSQERELNNEEWVTFISKLEKANFWNLPTEPRMPGLDGFSLFVEGVKEDKYHMVKWWSPEDKNFLEACNYLLKISGLKIDEKDIY